METNQFYIVEKSYEIVHGKRHEVQKHFGCLISRSVQSDQVYSGTRTVHPENMVRNRFPLKSVPKVWNRFKSVQESGLIDYPPKNRFSDWFWNRFFVVPLPHLLPSLIGSLSHCTTNGQCSSLPHSCVTCRLARLISLLQEELCLHK